MALEVEIEKVLPDFTLRVAFTAGRAPIGILGPSGAGKTMMLRTIAGLETPTRGRIVLDGRVLYDSAKGIHLPSRSRRVGLLFQHYALFPHLTVEQNVAFGLRDMEARERAHAAAAQIAAMHLSGFAQRHPAALSGGEQQRVALARALAPRPAALLLDEPFSALDTYLRSRLERQLRETLASFGGAALLVSHNLEELYRLCEEIVVLDKGCVIARGSRDEIFRRPPDRRTAELTGCRNFSRVRMLDARRVEALDWGCWLRSAQELPSTAGHVAIRAHHIHVAPPRHAFEVPGENIFPCWPVAATEGPFRVTLYLRLQTAAADKSDSRITDSHLQAEITQEQWATLKAQGTPWSVQLDPDLLFLLPD